MDNYQSSQLDALGDPTRRAILAALLTSPQPVGQLAQRFPVSRPAISQHLKILKHAGLVADRAVGTRRLYSINPDGFRSLRRYLDQFWTDALDSFKAKVEETTMDQPVRKSVTVKAPLEHTFRVFTAGFHTWWPKGHHIGKSPMKKAIIEGRPGGRCYTEQADGTECDWGSILEWDPPHRLLLAWQINGQWQYEPDLAQSSEVEVKFTAEGPGVTRVELEHRHLDRMGEPASTAARAMLDSPNGWGGTLKLFAAAAEEQAQ